MDWLWSLIGALSSDFRLADVVDIALMSVLAYTLIAWFRRAQSRFLITGLAVASGLYFVARLLDLTLTLYVFETVVTVALVTLVVIFQEDIRRAFERLATGPRFGPKITEDEAVTDILVNSLSHLAEHRIGALVVIAGREPLERHLTGGQELDGKPSEALFSSIFDASSDGHDGAVIMSDGLVRQFGVHLPLSTNQDADNRGLRHSAAMGLSERSDALILVVSEERGVISVADAGKLREVGRAELRKSLAERRVQKQTLAAGRLGVAPWSKLIAVAAAVGAWLVVFSGQQAHVERTFSIPVVLTEVPEGFDVESVEPRTLSVIVTGSNRAFGKLDSGALNASLKASGIRQGTQVLPLGPDSVVLPESLAIHSIQPGEITVVAAEMVEKDFRVEPKTVGTPMAGQMVVGGRPRVEPKTVRLRLPKHSLSRVSAVETESVDIDGLSATTEQVVGLILPAGAKLAADQPTSVTVTVEIGTARPVMPSPVPEGDAGPDAVEAKDAGEKSQDQ